MLSCKLCLQNVVQLPPQNPTPLKRSRTVKRRENRLTCRHQCQKVTAWVYSLALHAAKVHPGYNTPPQTKMPHLKRLQKWNANNLDGVSNFWHLKSRNRWKMEAAWNGSFFLSFAFNTAFKTDSCMLSWQKKTSREAFPSNPPSKVR